MCKTVPEINKHTGRVKVRVKRQEPMEKLKTKK
jgi:hypothetical protein